MRILTLLCVFFAVIAVDLSPACVFGKHHQHKPPCSEHDRRDGKDHKCCAKGEDCEGEVSSTRRSEKKTTSKSSISTSSTSTSYSTERSKPDIIFSTATVLPLPASDSMMSTTSVILSSASISSSEISVNAPTTTTGVIQPTFTGGTESRSIVSSLYIIGGLVSGFSLLRSLV